VSKKTYCMFTAGWRELH